ncbi:hypothetical protein ACFQ1M_03005 [Sungkyunkwania multivorans]|uniref:AsmA-like C-terminal domain-containing protein n=1 Tax=Sungkyunkwania multivorans TaxID=1173618 RepID=A0ABW3CTS5_9FLAO
MKTRRIYTLEMYRQFRYLATWLPGTPLELGDIGILRGKEFTKIGNLSEHGISFEIEPDDTPADLEFSSKGSVSIITKLSGTATPTGSTLSEADAGISVSFSKENAILFKANKTKTPAIKNQVALGKKVLELYKEGKWNKDWAVITELINAESGSVIISSSKEGKIDLKVNGELGSKQLDIADAELNFGLSFSKDLSTKMIAQRGITPLFKVSKVRSHLLMKPIFKMSGVDAMDLASPEAYKQKELDLYFGEPEFDFENDSEL